MKENLNESNNSENEEKKKFISEYDRKEKEKLINILKSLENNLSEKEDENIIEVYGKYAKNSSDFLKKEIKQKCINSFCILLFFSLLIIFYVFNVGSIFFSYILLENLCIVLVNFFVNLF